MKVKVEDGWVTLEGDLAWNYQKDSAKKSVKSLEGVKGVMNYINIKTENTDDVEKRNIENAFKRNWAIDNQEIHVEVLGNNVTLNGAVHSLYQKEEAERIAWNAPGVWSVNNELYVEYDI